MLPELFIKRIRTQDYIDPDSLISALEGNSETSIRVNNAKGAFIPGDSEKVPWCSSGYYLQRRPSFTLDPLFHTGAYYPQEASSMFLEEIFRQCVSKNESLKILDLCGAPGGKSTHLSSLIGNGGFLVSNEVIRQRAQVLSENLTKWGLSNAIVTRSDPSAFQKLPGYFDVILVDAPCSGEGMFRDQVARDEWSVENTVLCSERQKRILADVWPALKNEGLLIYSTCTFNPDENEKNIHWLIEKNKAVPVKIDISRYTGIKEIEYKGAIGYGFYPGNIRGEGLFYSVIRKNSDEPEYERKVKVNPGFRATTEQVRIAGELTDFKRESIINIGNSVYSIPCSVEDFTLLAKNLFIVKPGTQIFSMKGKDALPSHELAMSVFYREQAFPFVELSLDQALDYLRKENISVSGSPTGWIMAKYKGTNLGFLKNIGSRTNNYYPTEWRIRMIRSSDNERISIKWEY